MAEIPQPFSKQEISVGWPRLLIAFSVALFGMALASYFILLGYERVAESQSRNLDQKIQQLVTSLPATEVQKLLTLDRQIANLKELLPNHTYLSRILEYVEANTLPRIRLTNLSANFRTKRISLQGVAPDSHSASLQAAAFEKAASTKQFAIRSIASGVAGLNFVFDLVFDPALVLPR